jgi:predicted nucleic acid-binding protein
MIFQDIRTGDSVFVDANAFIYYFAADPVFGPACDQLLRRIENQDIVGFTSAHVLSEVAHRLMTLEASQAHGWPMTAISRRLKRHPSQVKALTRHRQAIDELALVGVQTLTISGSQVSHAADVTRQFGLLASDALIVVVMRDHGLVQLASHDIDFDRVPGLTRYDPA